MIHKFTRPPNLLGVFRFRKSLQRISNQQSFKNPLFPSNRSEMARKTCRIASPDYANENFDISTPVGVTILFGSHKNTSLCTGAAFGTGKMSLLRGSTCAFRILSANNSQVTVQNTRNIKRWVAPTLKEIKRRKVKMVTPQAVNRAGFIEWNWNSELFAFSKRLNEDFNPVLLQEAFTLRSYIIQEEQKQQEVGIDSPVTNLKDNSELARRGADLLSTYVEMFIASHLPKLPAVGVCSVRDYLLSDECLANVSKHIGTKDLILSAEFPPNDTILATAFKAVVGALNKSSGNDKTFEFVRDFLCTQLSQKDIESMWDIERPIETLQEFCKVNNLAEPEPRLLNDAGKNTILAVQHVGIYCDRRLLAAGFGEDVNTAIEVAAINCLKKLYDIENPRPYNFKITLNEIEESLQSKRQVERQI